AHHLEAEDTGSLRHGFDDQHTRHDRVFREMSVEERLIDADILVGANSLAFDVQVHHTIHQQERIAVRQIFTNFVDVHHVRFSLYEKKRARPRRAQASDETFAVWVTAASCFSSSRRRLAISSS